VSLSSCAGRCNRLAKEVKAHEARSVGHNKRGRAEASKSDRHSDSRKICVLLDKDRCRRPCRELGASTGYADERGSSELRTAEVAAQVAADADCAGDGELTFEPEQPGDAAKGGIDEAGAPSTSSSSRVARSSEGSTGGTSTERFTRDQA
jgi:hypothetical protein